VNALIEFTLYRCYMKDAEEAINAALAEAHLKTYLALLGPAPGAEE
jgi:hypothetical protein